MPVRNSFFDEALEGLRAARPHADEETLREALADALRLNPQFGRFMPGSYFYVRHGFGGSTPGSAFRSPSFLDRLQREADRQRNPERSKALATCRDLKRLRDGTTFDGERAAAQAALDRLMGKHGIGEGEI